MATIETRPFKTASQDSVDFHVSLVSPDVPIEELSSEWEYGQDVLVKVSADLRESFWPETETSALEDLWLTAVASCFSARSSWTEREKFRNIDGVWRAELTLKVDGNIASEIVKVGASISGLGRTGSADVRFATHRHAKLWESVETTLQLEQVEGFPTSAISFEEAGRFRVPWMVEVDELVELEQSYTSAVRLYVNTDLQAGMKIIDTTAPDETFQLIEADIQFAVLHALRPISEALSETELKETAEQNPQSFIAVGLQYAGNLKLPLKEAMRISHEEPLKFLAYAREAQQFMGRKARK